MNNSEGQEGFELRKMIHSDRSKKVAIGIMANELRQAIIRLGLEQMEKWEKEAVAEERYEDAAFYRDQIYIHYKLQAQGQNCVPKSYRDA